VIATNFLLSNLIAFVQIREKWNAC